jgi:hypothetical protein
MNYHGTTPSIEMDASVPIINLDAGGTSIEIDASGSAHIEIDGSSNTCTITPDDADSDTNFKQIQYYGSDGNMFTQYVLAGDAGDGDGGTNFNSAVLTYLQSLTWTGSCGDDGTITITVSD